MCEKKINKLRESGLYTNDAISAENTSSISDGDEHDYICVADRQTDTSHLTYRRQFQCPRNAAPPHELGP
jgi:hypothetical protein